MNVMIWTVVSGVAGAVAMIVAALTFHGTAWLYVMTVGALGIALAMVQAALLPWPLRHERRAWVLYGLLAALGGLAVLWGADWYLDDVVGGAGYGLVVGVMGWAIIRDSAPGAWRWVLLNVFGYGVVAILVLLTKYAFVLTAQIWVPALLLTTAAVGYGWLSGEGLRRLLYNND